MAVTDNNSHGNTMEGYGYRKENRGVSQVDNLDVINDCGDDVDRDVIVVDFYFGDCNCDDGDGHGDAVDHDVVPMHKFNNESTFGDRHRQILIVMHQSCTISNVINSARNCRLQY